MSKVNTLAITINGFLIGDLRTLNLKLADIALGLEREGMTEIRLDVSDVTDDLE